MGLCWCIYQSWGQTVSMSLDQWKGLPGWNKYLNWWKLISRHYIWLVSYKAHWVFKAAESIARSISFWNLWDDIFQQCGGVPLRSDINLGWLIFYSTFWVLKISQRCQSVERAVPWFISLYKINPSQGHCSSLADVCTHHSPISSKHPKLNFRSYWTPHLQEIESITTCYHTFGKEDLWRFAW